MKARKIGLGMALLAAAAGFAFRDQLKSRLRGEAAPIAVEVAAVPEAIADRINAIGRLQPKRKPGHPPVIVPTVLPRMLGSGRQDAGAPV